MELIFDTLMTGAADEPDALYGLLAEAVDVSDDGNVFTSSCARDARFHDGSPLTAEDVAFSLSCCKEKGHSEPAQTIREMTRRKRSTTATVVVTLHPASSRATLKLVGRPGCRSSRRPIIAEENDFEASTLTPPLGSGPYKVGRVSAGRYIEYRARRRLLGHGPAGESSATTIST